MSDLLLSFFGDDFTGSTDAMESLARCGVRTVLFTAPPSAEHLARYPGIGGFGIAGMTRSMTPDAMSAQLRPAFESLRASGAPIVHYKVCSTFDSSPAVGSIGHAIDIGMEVFHTRFVPVVVGAPSLGRHCVFGNLFARSGPESELFRLDRHPSMSRHPVTPMDEADLRRHLSKQTQKKIDLFDVLQIERPDVLAEFDDFRRSGAQVGLIDLLYERQLATVGSLLECYGKPTLVVGSSGVEAALCAHWRQTGRISGVVTFKSPSTSGPIVALCGSQSPVTAQQVLWASQNGFEVFGLNEGGGEITERASAAIAQNRSVVIHSRCDNIESVNSIGNTMGHILRQLLAANRVRRVLVAGGDTSGQIAHAIGVESMEMVAELTRGSPLCRVSAPGSPADGIEMTFKGGQIGPVDFFGTVRGL